MSAFKRAPISVGLLFFFTTCLCPQSRYDDAVARARTLLSEKKAREAVTLSEQAIQIDEKRWEAYVTAASAYSAQQLFDDAIGMLQLALGRAPQDRKQLIRDALAEARRQTAPSSVVGTASSAEGAGPMQAEIVLWKSIENSKSPDDYKAYLRQYPRGTFSALAGSRIETLQREKAAEAKPVDDLAGTTWTGEYFSLGKKGRISQGHLTISFTGTDCEIGLDRSYERGYWKKIGTKIYIQKYIDESRVEAEPGISLTLSDERLTGKYTIPYHIFDAELQRATRKENPAQSPTKR